MTTIYKHPWRIVKNIDHAGTLCFYSIHTKNNHAIAEVYASNNPKEETKNAYLISCAPELLETLELIQNWFIATNQANEMWDLLSYTVLKAKGKIGVDNPNETLI